MRTTVTIEPDTEILLTEEVRRTGLAFKEVLNQAIRRSLKKSAPQEIELIPLFPHPFPPELLHRNMNHLADELDDERTIQEMGG